jgi:hypothetical protein
MIPNQIVNFQQNLEAPKKTSKNSSKLQRI